MKRNLLLLLVSFLTLSGYAYEDNANNLVRHPSGDNVTVTATSSLAAEGQGAGMAIDGNDGTRWGNYGVNDADKGYLQIQWSSQQTFNTIKLLCEGAMSQSNANNMKYKIQTSDDGSNWTDRTDEVCYPAGEKEYATIPLKETVTASYVRFQGVTAGNYGYSFYEFEVYNIDYNNVQLTTLNVSPTFVYGDTELTFSPKDNNGNAITEGVSYSVEEGKGTLNGTTFKPSTGTSGFVTITATKDEKMVTAKIYVLNNDQALATPESGIDYGRLYPYDNEKTTEFIGQYDNKATVGTAIDLGSVSVLPIYDLGTLWIVNSNIAAGLNDSFNLESPKDYGKLHLELFSPEAASGKLDLVVNGNRNQNAQTISLTAGQWTTIEYDLSNATSLGNIGLQFEEANNKYPDVLLANAYFTQKSAAEPAVSITGLTISPTSGTTAETYTLTLTNDSNPAEATDNTKFTFTVKNGDDAALAGDYYELSEDKKTIKFKQAGSYKVTAALTEGATGYQIQEGATLSETVTVSEPTTTYELKSITLSKTESVKVDDEITITVKGTPSNATSTEADITSNNQLTFTVEKQNSNNENYSSIEGLITGTTFKATTAGSYRITVNKANDASVITGEAKTVAVTVGKLSVNAVTLTPNENVKTGEGVTIKVTDEKDNDITKNTSDIALTVKKGETAVDGLISGNTFTATESGTYTITATAVDNSTRITGSKDVQIEIAKGIPAPTAPVTDVVYKSLFPASEGTTQFIGDYDNKATVGEDMTISGQTVKPVTALGTLFIQNSTVSCAINNTFNAIQKEYDKLHIELYSKVAATGELRVQNVETRKIELAADTWTSYEFDVSETTNVGNVAIWMDKIDEVYPDIYLASIYFTKAAENPDKDYVASVTLTKSFVAKNTATDLGIKVMNNKGIALDADKYTLSADKGSFDAEGKFTATADGPITITATSTTAKDGTYPSATATLNTYPGADTAPEGDATEVLAVYSETYNATTYSPSDAGWNGGFGVQEETDLASGNKAISVSNAVCFGVNANASGVDISAYDYLNVSIYSAINISGKIVIEGTDMTGDNALPITLKANQWNKLKLGLSGKREGATWIQMYVGTADNKNNVFIDNVYFSKMAEGSTAITSLAVTPTSITVNKNASLTFTVSGLKKENGESSAITIENDKVDFTLKESSGATLSGTTFKGTATGTYTIVTTPKADAGLTGSAEATITVNDPLPVSISEPDEKGIVTVTGYVATDTDLSKITAIDAFAIDLSGAEFADNIKKVTPKYVNAMLIVAGEIGDANVATSAVATQLSETKNLIVKRGDGYYFPIKQLEITDGEPAWTGFFVSGNAAGWKYTRTIAANAMETALLPAAATLPEGLTAYTISSNSAEKMNLTKGGAAAQVPLLLYNATDAAITLTVEGNADFDARVKDTHTLEVETGTTFIGSYEAKTLTGAKTIVMKDGEPALQDITEVKPFRAYLTLTATPAKIIAQGINEPQEIKTITSGLDPKKVEIGKATDLKLKVTDTAGETIDNAKLTFTASPATIGTFDSEGLFKATTAGKFTVKVAPKDDIITGSAETTDSLEAVSEIPVQTLKTLTIGTSTVYVDTPMDLKLSVTDDSEEPQTIQNSKLTFTVTPEDAGEFGTDGKFTAKKAGEFTVTATPKEGEAYLKGTASAKATAAVLANLVLTTIPTPAADSIYAPVWTNTVTGHNHEVVWGTAYEGGAIKRDSITVEKNVAMPFYVANAVYFSNLSIADDIYNMSLNPSAKQYGKLHLSVYSPKADSINVVLEQTKKIESSQKFTLQANKWTEVEIDLDGETNIKAMSVRSNGANLALANIYFTKAAENPDSDIVAKLTLEKTLIAKNKAVDLGAVVVNNKGVELASSLYTLTADKGTFDEKGLFTATTDGPITITATSTVNRAKTATATVNTLPASATSPTDAKDKVLVVYSDTYGVTAYTPSDKGWNNMYDSQEEMELATGDKAIYVKEAGTFGLKLADIDLTDYLKVCAAIYSTEDYNGEVQIEGTTMKLAMTLKAGQWNYLTLPLSGTRTKATWLNFYAGPKPSTNTILVDNVYFAKLADDEMLISEPDAQDVQTVVGHVTTENVSELEELDAMAIDLSGADVTADLSSIKLKNVNAMIIVSGTMDGAEVTESAMADQLTGVQNVLVKREDGYYFPAKTLKITDGEPVWSGFLISGNSKGWTYSRTFEPGEVTTAYLPANIDGELPSDLVVYQYDSKDDDGLHFSRAELGEKQPRVVYNQSNRAVTINITSQGDLDLRPTEPEVDATGLVFVGTMSGVTGFEGYSLYSVSNVIDSERARTRGTTSNTVSVTEVDSELPFRAYFLSDDVVDTDTKVDIYGFKTGIFDIKADQADTDAIYNINGLRVEHSGNLRPGIYIKNGKKFVVR